MKSLRLIGGPQNWGQASYRLTSAPAHKIAVSGMGALGHKRIFAQQ